MGESESSEKTNPLKLKKIHYEQKYCKSWKEIPEFAISIKPKKEINVSFVPHVIVI